MSIHHTFFFYRTLAELIGVIAGILGVVTTAVIGIYKCCDNEDGNKNSDNCKKFNIKEKGMNHRFYFLFFFLSS